MSKWRFYSSKGMIYRVQKLFEDKDTPNGLKVMVNRVSDDSVSFITSKEFDLNFKPFELIEDHKLSKLYIDQFIKSYIPEVNTDYVYNYLNQISEFKPLNHKFKHYKTGNIYELLCITLEATNDDEGHLNAIYKNEHGCIFNRELNEFLIKFEYLDG